MGTPHTWMIRATGNAENKHIPAFAVLAAIAVLAARAAQIALGSV
jgi:hypothetical protein